MSSTHKPNNPNAEKISGKQIITNLGLNTHIFNQFTLSMVNLALQCVK